MSAHTMIDDDHESWSHPAVRDAGNYVGRHKFTTNTAYKGLWLSPSTLLYFKLKGGAFK